MEKLSVDTSSSLLVFFFFLEVVIESSPMERSDSNCCRAEFKSKSSLLFVGLGSSLTESSTAMKHGVPLEVAVLENADDEEEEGVDGIKASVMETLPAMNRELERTDPIFIVNIVIVAEIQNCCTEFVYRHTRESIL